MKKRYLFLEDGTYFPGYAFGFDKEVTGEVVFSTLMVGYPESLTDPSYQEQILVFTYPLIGNYGVPDYKNTYSFESKGIKVKGLIVSYYVEEYSHFEAVKSLNNWLKKEEIPAITGIDTRALTVKLRQKGTMLAAILEKPRQIKFIDPKKENLVKKVSVKRPKTYGCGKKKILLFDCGVKEGILDNFLKRDTTIYQVPWDYDPFNDQPFNYQGVVISNGPGDPKKVRKTIATVKKILKKKIPVLGICLGNQILALAAGANTYKLKFGHRSSNQPVLLVGTNRCFLTTQNHGFAVDEKTLPSGFRIWFRNLNDGTVEGIKHKKLPFIAVQFHPEGRPGPYDTNWVFDYFLERIN